MKKRIFWMTVFMLFTMLVSGLYLGARQQPKTQPSSTSPTKNAAAAVPSIMAVRMHVHDIEPTNPPAPSPPHDPQRDHADDDDHCIKFDPKPSSSPSPTNTPSPLKVDVDLDDDPKGDLKMDINMFYIDPSGDLASEHLSSSCTYDPQNPTTCTATFHELTASQFHIGGRAKLVLPWHLGDQPDGTYLADGSLSTTTAVAASASAKKLPLVANFKKIPGLPDTDFFYAFRNPSDCKVPSLGKKKPK